MHESNYDKNFKDKQSFAFSETYLDYFNFLRASTLVKEFLSYRFDCYKDVPNTINYIDIIPFSSHTTYIYAH